MNTDVLIADFIGQCYNDALRYSELADEAGIGKPVTYWSNCTASILMASLCIEAFLNEMMRLKISEIDAQFLSDYNSARLGFYNKLDLLETSLDLTLDKSDQAWMQIRDTIKLRNDIVHYTRNTIFQDIKIDNANTAIQAARDFITKFYDAMGEDYHPRWRFIDETQSQIFDR